eukprot:scaffold169895_cov15-Tisochrysis_lutea.AAC.1
MTGTCPVSKTCTALLPFQASAAKHAVLIYSSCASICSVITFANRSDFISFRHHTYLMPKGAKSVELTEVCAVTHAAPEQILVTELEGAASDCGPRFELKLFQIKLGTMDQQHVENEWVLRSYTRAAKKQRLADPKADGKE